MTLESSTLLSMRLENFKSWKDTGAITLRPLTAFFGVNSSGKSSLLQALLLLKQTTESRDVRTPLRTKVDKEGYVDLGSISNLIHHGADHVQIDLGWQLGQPISISDGQIKLSALRFSAQIDKSAQVEHLEYDSSGEQSSRLFVSMSRQKDDSYTLDAQINNQALTRLPGRPREGFPPPLKCYGFPDEVQRTYREAELFSDLSLAFERLFNNILYLGPLREYPQRIYTWAGEKPSDVGLKGELAIPVLFAAGSQPVYVQRGRKVTLARKVEEQLRELGLAKSLNVRSLDTNKRHYEVQIVPAKGGDDDTNRVLSLSIPDLGFGVSQVLPVLVLCYYAPPGATVILEQPEIHLHPSAQAGLADVFIDVIKKRHLRLIIESHSEPLLRRIQRRIAEGAITPEDTAIYFCDLDEDGTSRLEELQIDLYGDIQNWPKDFFGDITGDLLEAAKAGLKRANGKIASSS
jgi:predicted ATPase